MLVSPSYPSAVRKGGLSSTLDGRGRMDDHRGSPIGDGKDLAIHKEIHFPHSLGLLLLRFLPTTRAFKVNSGEYKLMVLAPYGDAEIRETSFAII